jgi:hypothetical protein
MNHNTSLTTCTVIIRLNNAVLIIVSVNYEDIYIVNDIVLLPS